MGGKRDFIAELGPRAFGTRLRRLNEELSRGLAQAYGEASEVFEPRWFGLLNLLNERPQVDIGTAATALGQSHVAVVQVANALELRGLARRIAAPQDRRMRVLEITAKGHALCVRLAPLWDAVATATQTLLDEAAPGFLEQIAALDAALARRPFAQRIKDQQRST